MTRRLCVGLLGPYASQNLGDTAIQTAVITNLRSRSDDLTVFGICADPEDTKATHGIDAFPLTWESSNGEKTAFAALPWRLRELGQRIAQLPAIFSCLAKLDLLLISGGGQLDEFWGGAFRHPYLLFVWTAIARLRGLPVAAFGVGWDHLVSPAGQWLCVRAVKSARLVVVRDQGTLRMLRQHGIKSTMLIAPDPAFGLRRGRIKSSLPITSPRRFIAISPIAPNAVPEQFRDRHPQYLRALAFACSQWIEDGFDIRFVSSQPSMDSPCIAQIIGSLRGEPPRSRIRIADSSSVDSFLSEVTGATLVVAARLHSLILALVAGCPVIGINYSRKILEVMRDCALLDFLVQPEALEDAELIEKSRMIIENEQSLRAGIGSYVATAEATLSTAYDSLLDLAKTR